MQEPTKIDTFGIPPEGQEVMATTVEDRWLRELADEALPGLTPRGEVSLLLLRGEGHVELSGDLSFDITPPCDRCLETIQDHLFIPLHQVFLPESSQDRAMTTEASSDEEDVDCSYFSGHAIDLKDSLHEQIILALPPQFHCNEFCRGLCTRCGVNLNQGACSCPPIRKANPFAALKALP